MNRRLAVISILTTVLFFTGCSSTAMNNNSQPTVLNNKSWQQCAAVGGAVWAVPGALASLATGGITAVAGALVSGIGCAVADNPVSVVNFNFDSYTLDMKDRLILDDIAKQLGNKRHIKLVGFTCDIGTDEVNQQLSEDRVTEVKKYLMSKGIQEYRIKAEGRGKETPAVANDSEENRQLNRRVEMVILNKQ